MHGTVGTYSCGFAGVFLETGPGGPGCSSLTPCPRSSLTPSAGCWENNKYQKTAKQTQITPRIDFILNDTIRGQPPDP